MPSPSIVYSCAAYPVCWLFYVPSIAVHGFQGICGIVEHDAYILTLLYVIRDLAVSSENIDPWPLYWTLLWAGTLGGNLTIAGAPALFVAVNLGEKEDCCKMSMREFFSYTVVYVVVSLIICYVIAMFLWVLPFV